jgi:hypothetical protein
VRERRGSRVHRLDSGPEIVEAFVKSPHTLLTKDIRGTDSVDGFLVYALAEHTWRSFG